MTQTTKSSTPPCSNDLISKIDAETPKGLPAKPKDAAGFERPVAWLGGRELVASLKLIILYGIFGGKLDARDWMTGMFNPIKDVAAPAPDPTKAKTNEAVYSRVVETGRAAGEPEADEFWFDYVADSGDGQMPTYNIAYLCMRHLQLTTNEGERMLPRGKFLFVGGDTAYHVADYATLAKRFQAPFWWAYKDLVCEGEIPAAEMSTRRPIFAIPGNHDYYDVLDGFNRQFRRPITDEDDKFSREPLLQLPTFERHQEASYVAVQLPFDWWLWGLDIERNDIDFRQETFFKKIKKKEDPKKLIIATPSPTTVFGQHLRKDTPLAKVFETIGLKRLFLKDEEKEETDRLAKGECRLDLSGDVHHYARYWGPKTAGDGKEKPRGDQDKDRPWDNSYASVVSGGGGAFFDSTNTFLGDIKEQALYPTVSESLRAISEEVLDVSVIRSGGFVHYIGAFIAFLIYFAAIIAPNTNVLLFPDSNPKDFTIISWWLGSVVISLILLVLGNLVLGKVGIFKTVLKSIDRWIEPTEPEWYNQEPLQKKFAVKQTFVICGFLVVTLLFMGLGIWNVAGRGPFRAFSNSLLIFLATAWAAFMVALYLQYTERLNGQASKRPLRKYLDYGPTWLMLIVAALIFCSGLVFFGRSGGALPAPLFADMVFITVVIVFPLGLIVGLAWSVGAGRHGSKGKVGYVVMGSWHTLLQLIVPLLWTLSLLYYFNAQRISTLNDILKSIGLILSVALILGVSYWGFRRIGIRYIRKNYRKRLVATWIVYGLVMIVLPALYLLWERSNRNAVTIVKLEDTTLPWLLTLCIPAAFIGAFMSCVWFGWYLAVALLFNGHNNEAGGAARLEGYKQFIRIRLTKDDLTAYVIGFDKAQAEAKDLIPNLKLIDQFTLTVKSN